jgi:hypothetical protein
MKDDLLGHTSNLTGAIVDGIAIRQSFVAIDKFLMAINICFATYKRENSGQMYLTVVDRFRKEVGRCVEDISKIKDHAYHEFKIEAPLTEGKAYEIILYTKNARSGRSVTAKWGPSRHRGQVFFNLGSLIPNAEMACLFRYGEKGQIEKEERREKAKDEKDQIRREGIPGLVGIIITSYNSEQLPECLRGIEEQTYNCTEIIVVDDGSDDINFVRETVKSLEETIPITLFEHEEHKGEDAVRETALKNIRGEYSYFVNGDTVLGKQDLENFLILEVK